MCTYDLPWKEKITCTNDAPLSSLETDSSPRPSAMCQTLLASTTSVPQPQSALPGVLLSPSCIEEKRNLFIMYSLHSKDLHNTCFYSNFSDDISSQKLSMFYVTKYFSIWQHGGNEGTWGMYMGW